MVAEIGPKLAT